jgi:hypothetical protein
MVLQLDRVLFKRLLWLNVASLILDAIAVMIETLSPRYVTFSAEFDQLVTKHFGSLDDFGMWPGFALAGWLLICAIWGLASIMGLFKFKPWARRGFWGSYVAAMPMYFVPGIYPAYTLGMSELAFGISMMLFGAIMLMAYGRNLGADWFERPAETGT